MAQEDDQTSGAAIEWTAREYIHYAKDSYWYVVAGIISLVVIAYCIVTKSVLSFIVFALLIALSYAAIHQKPRYVRIGLYPHGIAVGDDFVKYIDLGSFWVVYDPPAVKVLHLRRKGGFLTDMTIQLEAQNPTEVRSFLLAYVPEEKNSPHEAMTDRLMRWLKF